MATFAFFLLAVLVPIAVAGFVLLVVALVARRRRSAPVTARRLREADPRPATGRGRPAPLSSSPVASRAAQAPPSTTTARPAAHHAAALRLEVDVNVVSVTAVIFDKAGHFVPGLGPQDVELLEDGVKQEVTYFREASGGGRGRTDPPLRGPRPRHLGQHGARTCASSRRPPPTSSTSWRTPTRAMVVSFNESVKGSTEFTSDIERLEQIDRRPAGLGRHQPLRRRPLRPGPGEGPARAQGGGRLQRRRRHHEHQLQRPGGGRLRAGGGGHHLRASASAAPPASSPRAHKGFFRKLADETGGAFFFPDKMGELNKIFGAIANELQEPLPALVLAPRGRPTDRFAPSACAWFPPRRKDVRGASPQGLLRDEALPSARPTALDGPEGRTDRPRAARGRAARAHPPPPPPRRRPSPRPAARPDASSRP